MVSLGKAAVFNLKPISNHEQLCTSNQHGDNMQRTTQAQFRLYKTLSHDRGEFRAELIRDCKHTYELRKKRRLAYDEQRNKH